MDDWVKNWLGLLLVNTRNKDEKKSEEKENWQKL